MERSRPHLVSRLRLHEHYTLETLFYDAELAEGEFPVAVSGVNIFSQDALPLSVGAFTPLVTNSALLNWVLFAKVDTLPT